MAELVPDPLAGGSLAQLGRDFRARTTSSEAMTAAYLARIEALDARLGSFETVMAESALAQARAMDRLFAAGTDLGPLMGVPIAIKDIVAVDGAPTTAGSNVAVGDLIGPEGSFVGALKRAGCVILGKTRTPEFANGGGRFAISSVRPTPWNPWDAETQRVPGGSSSGSAVAVAAGLCAFAIGSDTGASVRAPAALCGVFGLKTTAGLWPLDGVFPLSRSLDTLGMLAHTAADAGIVLGAIAGSPPPDAPQPRSLRLGLPEPSFFFADLDSRVRACTDAALDALRGAGVELVPVAWPEVPQVGDHMASVVAAEFMAGMGRERFEAVRKHMDPYVAAGLAAGLEIGAVDYVNAIRGYGAYSRAAAERMAGVDALVTPTVALTAPAVASFEDRDFYDRHSSIGMRNTRPASFAGLCATSNPVQGPAPGLPVGLQVIAPGFEDARAVAIAETIERVVGPQSRPDLDPFMEGAGYRQ
ncbi:MAG: amidase [Rhodospirillales bacterium]|nr:amidase [Rhodospirillales bacterium]